MANVRSQHVETDGDAAEDGGYKYEPKYGTVITSTAQVG